VSLPHLLLGLLSAEPRTGYDLARAVRDEIEPAWSAGYSQIYPALATLRRHGWVLLRTLGPRRGPPRLLYRATAAGRRELQRWLGDPPPPPRRNDAILARIALLDALPPAARAGILSGLAAVLEAEAARLDALGAGEGSRRLARQAAAVERRALALFLEGAAAPAPALRRSARSRPVSSQSSPRARRRKYHR
jgi:DNA-binding PadR family transcriptional regulator